jgi:hypothetical protein
MPVQKTRKPRSRKVTPPAVVLDSTPTREFDSNGKKFALTVNPVTGRRSIVPLEDDTASPEGGE